jgi:hypothetical protein
MPTTKDTVNHHTSQIARLEQVMTALAEAQVKTEENISKLAKAQAKTDAQIAKTDAQVRDLVRQWQGYLNTLPKQ